MEALAGGVLIASTALVVSRLVDDNSATVPVQAPEAAAANPAVVNPAVATPQARLVINEPIWRACGDGFADACHSTHVWVQVPELASPAEAAAEVCRGGLEWACAFTPQS
jgi:hypothetical protein